jgi:hypothetical protein
MELQHFISQLCPNQTLFLVETIRQKEIGRSKFAACFGDIGTLLAAQNRSPKGLSLERWFASLWSSSAVLREKWLR